MQCSLPFSFNQTGLAVAFTALAASQKQLIAKIQRQVDHGNNKLNLYFREKADKRDLLAARLYFRGALRLIDDYFSGVTDERIVHALEACNTGITKIDRELNPPPGADSDSIASLSPDG